MTNDVPQKTPASKRMYVRLEVDLRVTIKAAAKACGLSLSGYVRDRLTSAARQDLKRARAESEK